MIVKIDLEVMTDLYILSVSGYEDMGFVTYVCIYTCICMLACKPSERKLYICLLVQTHHLPLFSHNYEGCKKLFLLVTVLSETHRSVILDI